MPDIFLSYNREDQARAKVFAEAFERDGFSVWWDVALRSGEAYDEVTEAALRAAKAVVVLWSKKSVASRWVRAEATLAERTKTLVPAMIEPCERPIMFELTQTAELSHWGGLPNDKAWLSFLADVRRFTERSDSGSAIATSTLAEIVAAPPPKRETMLAVLPFDNLSSEADMQFFSDGVSEEIISRLTRGSRLKVIGRTSSFQFRGADKPRAAEALSVTHVVDGSVQRASNRVRVAAHLSESSSGANLWSERYDRTVEDIFAVQDEISQAIAEALQTAFLPHKIEAIDPATFDLYLRARDWEYEPAKIANNIASLEKVTQQAPNFADGWGRLAVLRAATRHALQYEQRTVLKQQIHSDVARCLALDPRSVQARIAQFHLLAPFGDFSAQHKVAVELKELGANSPQALNVCVFRDECVGRGRDAIALSRRAFELDPMNANVSTMRGQSLWRAGRFAEGRAAMERTLEIWPHDQYTAAALILACLHQGDWAAVDVLIDPDRLERYPLREFGALLGLVAVMRNPTLDNRQMLLAALQSRVAATGRIDPFTLVWPAALGFVEETYALLKTAKFGPAGVSTDVVGFNAYRTNVLFMAAFPELRADPRFATLCARLGLVEYWIETAAWPDCAAETPYDFEAECRKARDTARDLYLG